MSPIGGRIEGLEVIFNTMSPEGYSKEKYEDTEREIDKANESVRIAKVFGDSAPYTLDVIEGLKEKQAELVSKGKEEAGILNKEYDRRAENNEYKRLVEEADKAIKAIEDFQRERFNKPKTN